MSSSFDPRHRDSSPLLIDRYTGVVTWHDSPLRETATSQSDQATAVLHWSPDQVQIWLEHSVPFQPARMQEFLHAFRSEIVDGLSLLTLRRSHRACQGLTSSEWHIFTAARRRLVSGGEIEALSDSSRITTEDMCSSSAFNSTSNNSLRNSMAGHPEGQKKSMLASSRKGLWGFRWGGAKDDQVNSLEKEVQSLRGEIVGAEERETTLQAQLGHLDEVLRTAQLAGYIHTRTRWMALPCEPPIDDTDVDDWLLRFLVLHDDSICFYLRATDLRPQGTILLSEIVEAGPIAQHKHHEGDTHWFAFHITTCHGLRLECSSQLKLQVECWLTTLGVGIDLSQLERRLFEIPQSAAWRKVLSPEDLEVDASEEGSLFGEQISH